MRHFWRPVCPGEALVDCIQDIEVESLGHGGWRLGWQPNFSARAVAVHWGPQPDAIHPIALVSGAHGTAELRLPEACARPYFELVAEDGARIVVAERWRGASISGIWAVTRLAKAPVCGGAGCFAQAICLA
jgi:hypothetical protein